MAFKSIYGEKIIIQNKKMTQKRANNDI